MPLKVKKSDIEVEREIGYKYLQMLARAEALVPGAGREAIEPLLWDANAVIIRTDVQNDRVVLDGTLNCQAVYRQGEETSLRALSAKASISQVTEIPDAQGGMLSRVQPVVENVETRYENGHMVFQVSLGIHVRVMKLEHVEMIDALEDAQGLETRFQEVCLTRLAAEATETAVLTGRVDLPEALDARATLMDWGSVSVDSAEADLGGVRVKGKAQIETLIASGLEGRPAVLVKYPIEFDKLIELPEWLSQTACVVPSVRSVRTQLEQSGADGESALAIQADVHFAITANLRECMQVLEDAYSTGEKEVKIQKGRLTACRDAHCLHAAESVRGTVLLEEGAPAVGSVIAARILPNIAEIRALDKGSRISGLMEAMILYMPSGSDVPTSTHAQLPFELDMNWDLGENPMVSLEVTSAEANALMSDRLEMKVGLSIDCEARIQQTVDYVTDMEEGETIARKPAYIICWPEAGEDAWSVGKRYAIPTAAIDGKIDGGKALVLRI